MFLNYLLWIASGALVGILIDFFQLNFKKEYLKVNAAIGVMGGYMGGVFTQFVLWPSDDAINVLACIVAFITAYIAVRHIDYFFGLVK